MSDLTQNKVPILETRVAGNAVAYWKNVGVVSFQHTATGEYTFTFDRDIDWSLMNVRCTLFGDPNTND